MKKRYTVHLGVNVNAYAQVEIEAESDEEAQRLAIEVLKNNGDVVFDTAWETACDDRIVSVDDEDGDEIMDELYLDDVEED